MIEALFARNTDAVLRALKRTIDRLHKVADRNEDKSSELHEQADALRLNACRAEAEADRARGVAAKLSALID